MWVDGRCVWALGAGLAAQAALDAAAEAFPAWARKTPYQRGAVLERAADLIAERADAYARRTAEESGKPLAQARGEWAGAQSVKSVDPLLIFNGSYPRPSL